MKQIFFVGSLLIFVGCAETPQLGQDAFSALGGDPLNEDDTIQLDDGTLFEGGDDDETTGGNANGGGTKPPAGVKPPPTGEPAGEDIIKCRTSTCAPNHFSKILFCLRPPGNPENAHQQCLPEQAARKKQSQGLGHLGRCL